MSKNELKHNASYYKKLAAQILKLGSKHSPYLSFSPSGAFQHYRIGFYVAIIE